MRAKKAFRNTLLGFLQDAVRIVCAFILPRIIITSFGSNYVGLTNAITQFLQVIVLFQAGIGGVTRAALYKPLACNDVIEINRIIRITESFVRKVSVAFLATSLVVAVGYPYFVRESFDWLFTASLVLIMSVSTFMQYFFGLTYQFLLQADQRQGFISILESIKIILSTFVSVILINSGFGIHAVKLGSAIVFILPPIFLNIYVKRKYEINESVKITDTKLPQLWDNFGQQVAMFVCTNTDLVVLSIFSTLNEVSVYSVYNMVMSGVYQLFQPLVNGVTSAFGNMFAKGEYDSANKYFRLLEEIVFMSSSFLFGVTAATVVPFVKIYTNGVMDVNYDRMFFASIFSATMLFKCYRMPYAIAVAATGRFRQMRTSAFIEASLNIVLSILLVFKFGIVGVLIGTLTSYMYRIICYAVYVSREIIQRPNFAFIKRVLLSVLCATVIAFLPYLLPLNQKSDYFSWIQNTSAISLFSLIIVVGVEYLFYRKDLKMLLKMLLNIVMKKRKSK